MISFQYKREGKNILITLRTDSTQFGTFYRIATVIYALQLDIISGELGTVEEDGIYYTEDSFLLYTQDIDPNHAAYQLGVMMDSLFSQNAKFEEVLGKLQIPEPPVETFFKENPEFIFSDIPEKNLTCLYLETGAGRGLLYYISRIFVDFGINIVSATIETDQKTGRAKDSFYLRTEQGEMFSSLPLADAIRKAIMAPSRAN